jgi:GT2 family glycosyltransferase
LNISKHGRCGSISPSSCVRCRCFSPSATLISQPPTARWLCGAAPPDGGYDADIIILTLNRFNDTIDAVDSALRQTGALIHVTILDQGSEPAVLARFTEAFAERANLWFFACPQNSGVGAGRNLLTSLGHGRIIVALDNDATFQSDTTVAAALTAFDLTPELGALGFKILAKNGIDLDASSWGYPASLLSRAHDCFTATTFVGAGHAIRRTAWQAAGGYDPWLFFTWEEYDFCLRAIAAGWTVRYDGSISVIHKVAAENRLAWNGARTRLSMRNRLLVARKWRTSWLALLPRIGLYLWRASLKGRPGAACLGLIDAIRQDHVLPKQTMPGRLRDYLSRHDRAHRGKPVQGIRALTIRLKRPPSHPSASG